MVISSVAAASRFLARQDLADLGVDILGRELAFRNGNIYFAGVYRLGQIVHNNLGPFRQGRLQLLFTLGIGPDGVDMGSRH